MPEIPPRRRGRPRRAVDPAAIHVKMAPVTFDAACRQAAREDVTVPELLRRALQQRLEAPPRP